MSADRKIITAAEMDNMSPQERADTVDAGIVRDWSDVDPQFRPRVEQRARDLSRQLEANA